MKHRQIPETEAAFAGFALDPPQSSPAPKVHITTSVMLWTLKGTFEEKLEASARAGLQSVELVGEYAPWTDADIARIKKTTRSLGLGTDTLLATPDWSKRPVSMVDPAQRDNFLADVRSAIVFAHKLEIPQIILMSGNAIPGRSHEEQYASLLEGIKRAGDLAAQSELTMIVEPLNSVVNHRRFFLNNCAEGLRLVREVDNPHVKLLLDIYHEQVQQGNVIPTLAEAAPTWRCFMSRTTPGATIPALARSTIRVFIKSFRKLASAAI
jgi:hydroxypyruvate isomerase